MSDILKRIERQAGVDNLVDLLSERLDTSDLNSLLMEVFRRRSEKRTPTTLLDDYRSNRFVKPSTVDPALMMAWDQIAFASLPQGFTAVELSPLCPLGTNSTVATVSQNKSVVTTRAVEVMSDASNVLALECAVHRRKLLAESPKSTQPVKLAASHRVVRPEFDANPIMLPHFRLFALCSAGRDTGSDRFRDGALMDHIPFHLRSLRKFFNDDSRLRVAVTVLDESARPHIALVMDRLRETAAGVDVVFDDDRTKGRGYYQEVCFKVHSEMPDGWIELGDGGLVDWARSC